MIPKNQINAKLQLKLHTLKEVTDNLIKTIGKCVPYLNGQYKSAAVGKLINQANTSFQFLNQFNQEIKNDRNNITNSQINKNQQAIQFSLKQYQHHNLIKEILNTYKKGLKNQICNWMAFTEKCHLTEMETVKYLAETFQGICIQKQMQENLYQIYLKQEQEGKLQPGKYISRMGNSWIN